jgi:hypothetical protein
MNRTTFLVLLNLPFISIFFIKPDIWFFISAWLYFTVLKLIRFRSVGLTIKQILLVYTPLGFKYWPRLFEKDDVSFNHLLE